MLTVTYDRTLPFTFPSVPAKKITADFDGGRVTSNRAVMLLGMAERYLGIACASPGSFQTFARACSPPCWTA